MAYYQLLLTQKVWQQSTLNLFNFYSSAPGPILDGAEDLVNTWTAFFLPELRRMMKLDLAQYVILFVSAYDVNNDTDFYEKDYGAGITGLDNVNGEAAPPFLSFAYRTDRWRVGRNRGYKRFSGITEGTITGNTYQPGGTVIADVITALETVVVGAVGTYYPSIAGKERYNPDPAKPDEYAYRYYATETEQRAASSAQNVWNGYRLTTQRSRIAGHGQ